MRDCLIRELEFRTSRSSGPGGQHVNKTESRVELIWDPAVSECLGPLQKQRLLAFLSSRLTDQGHLILASGKHRSQLRNKEEVTERFLSLVREGLVPVKKRRPTRPTKASKERRLREKKQRAELKKSRRDQAEE